MSNGYDLNKLNEMHMDVLREIGNIGSGNAATSLAGLLDKTIDISVPSVKILDINDAVRFLGGVENIVVAVLSKFMGDADGFIMLVIDRAFAENIVETVCGTKDEVTRFSELELSAIAETGNILISSYVNSIATLSGLMMKTSVPSVCIDMVGAVLSVPAIEIGSVSDSIIFIENDFFADSQKSTANMLLVPEASSLSKIMSNLGIDLC